MQVVRLAEPLDGGDLRALMHHGERQAGIDAPPVHDHRAGPALTVVAALLRAGQVQVLARGVEERGAGVEFEFAARAVHREGDLGQDRPVGPGQPDARLVGARIVGARISRPGARGHGGRGRGGGCSHHQVSPIQFEVSGSSHLGLRISREGMAATGPSNASGMPRGNTVTLDTLQGRVRFVDDQGCKVAEEARVRRPGPGDPFWAARAQVTAARLPTLADGGPALPGTTPARNAQNPR
ncbi:hypothetical protein AEGHOMDF_3915 [Methylobacterium soli]|nr:hypothetical protein AEGHOMDF_3915 [Methylobacterium soli]